MTREYEWIMAPYMIEMVSSKLMWRHNIGISIAQAALSLEVFFKSFHAEISANEGLLNERYKLNENGALKDKNKHDLLDLYESLPEEIRILFHNEFIRDMIVKYRRAFLDSRYVYERKALQSGTDALASIASDSIRKTVSIYKERGCDDEWITRYPNI